MNTTFKYLFLGIVCLCLFSCKSKQTTSANKNSSVIAPKITETSQDREFSELFYSACKDKMLSNYEDAAKSFFRCVALKPNNAAANYELANNLYHQGRINEATLHSKKAFEVEPQNSWYAKLYVQSLQREQKNEESAKVLVKNLSYNKEKIEVYYELASAYLMANKFKDAIATYNLIEKKIGVSEDISLQKEKIYSQLGKNDLAIEEILKLIKAFPNESRYYGILAELYGAVGKPEKAMETFTKILTVDPNNGYVHFSLAEYYRSIGDKEKSFNELKLAMASDQVDIDTKMRVMLSYFSLTDNDTKLKEQAFEMLDVLIKVNGNEAKSWSVYGDFLYRDKRVKEARDAYKKAVEIENDKFVIWNQLIVLNSELNDVEELYSSCKKALEIFPTQVNLYLFYGLASIQKKEYLGAIKTLNDGFALVFGNEALKAQFYMYLGDSYNAIKDNKLSDENYDKALKADPNSLYVLNNWSYFLSIRNEKLEKAEEMSRKALNLEPNQPNYEDTYAWILFKQNKFTDAKYWLERAITNGGGGNVTILEHLGDTYIKLEQPDKALEYWNKAKEKVSGELLDKKIKDKKYYEK